MGLTGIFDALFVDQLFHTDERGETIFYPNGMSGRGYLVPCEREAAVRSGVRRLALVVLILAIGLVWLVRATEARLGATVPFGWFIAGALVAIVVIFTFVIRALSRLTVGLAPVAERLRR